MKIIAVDDEKIALMGIVAQVKKIMPDADVVSFRNPVEAVDYARENVPDVVLLDVEMREMNGIQAAGLLREISPSINIIFTTGYSEFTKDAMDLHASGYLMKPITKDKLKAELEDLRYPVTSQQPEEKPGKSLRAQTFGTFDFLVDGKSLAFKYNKTKELLAYLIDREGKNCSIQNIMAALWGDESGQKNSYMKNIRKDLISTFEELGYPDLIIQRRGSLCIDASQIDCDYYDLLKDDPKAIASFHGEYMSDYEWGEYTLGYLLKYDDSF